jgi:cyclopropane-fatty-acyl-phospholipid synthase
MSGSESKAKYSGASPDAIRDHYDRGTSFYKLWLDESLTYSCGLWDGASSLEDAQIRKLDFHIQNAEAVGAGRVLDVGCGWGSLLERAVNSSGVEQAIGLTLSKDQLDYVKQRGVNGVDARLENWVDHSPDQEYDAVFCIGMLEHCAHIDLESEAKVAAYRAFFQKCRSWLRGGGCLSLQTICFGTLRELDPFIREKIWPESNLPCLSEIVTASETEFETEAMVAGRHDYALTCREWAKKLEARHVEAAELVGDEAVSDFLRFLKMSAKAFDIGAFNLYRLKLRRIG